jgi:hypothetical protein
MDGQEWVQVHRAQPRGLETGAKPQQVQSLALGDASVWLCNEHLDAVYGHVRHGCAPQTVSPCWRAMIDPRTEGRDIAGALIVLGACLLSAAVLFVILYAASIQSWP